MKSALKTLVPLVLLFAVVFGVILVVQYSPPKEDPKDAEKRAGGGGEPPLRFFTDIRRWDPDSDILENREFPGFFEKDAKGSALFWFENRNTEQVSLQLKGVSCSSCSDGWLAPLPVDTTRAILQMSAVSCLPMGPVSFLPVGMAGPAAGIDPARLDRQSHDFRTTDWMFVVPPANNADGWSPQWGILSLNFKAGPRSELMALFASQVKNSGQLTDHEFRIAYVATNAFDVTAPEIPIGDVTDTTPPKTYEIVVFSTTRGAGTAEQLGTPTVKVLMPGGTGDPGQFVTAGTPQPVGGADLAALAQDIPRRLPKSPTGELARVRVRSAFRIPVVVSPQVGDSRMDIGAMEREVWIACGDAQPRPVRVKGTVHGGMWLGEEKEIDLKLFKYQAGLPETKFELVTDNPGAEVVLSKTEVDERDAGGDIRKVMRDHVVVNSKVAPETLKVSVERQDRKEPDRGYYWIKVAVPPGAHQGQLVNSYVVVEIKGPNPRRFRIPIKGSGTQ